MRKGIFVTLYPDPPQRFSTHSFGSWESIEAFLSPVKCEAVVRDDSGRARFRWIRGPVQNGTIIMGLVLANTHPKIVARVKRRAELEAARKGEA